MAELAAGASPCPSAPLPMRVQGCSLTWGGSRGRTQLAAVGGGDTMTAARASAGSSSRGVPTSPRRPPRARHADRTQACTQDVQGGGAPEAGAGSDPAGDLTDPKGIFWPLGWVPRLRWGNRVKGPDLWSLVG